MFSVKFWNDWTTEMSAMNKQDFKKCLLKIDYKQIIVLQWFAGSCVELFIVTAISLLVCVVWIYELKCGVLGPESICYLTSKMSYYQSRNSHFENKTDMKSFYFHNGNSCSGKMLGIPQLVKCYLYIESAPRYKNGKFWRQNTSIRQPIVQPGGRVVRCLWRVPSLIEVLPLSLLYTVSC